MKTIALVAVLAAACYPARSSGPEVQTIASPSAPFGEYHTFSFGFTDNPPTSYQASARSLEVERRVRGLMDAALREKGYVEDDTTPNFVVRFGAGTQQAQTEGYLGEDSAGSSYGVSLGKITVDIFDASTKTEVWRGSAVSRVDLTKDIDNRVLERAVQGVLASFPTRSAGDVQPARPIAVSRGR